MHREEDSLIISCARTAVSPSLAREIQGLANKELDWGYVLQASQQHAVLPLVYRNLREVCPASLPDSLLLEMKNHYRSSAVRNMHMAARLLKILSLLEKHGLVAAPFKGPVLAESVYGNLGLRNFGDLDILIWPHDAARAMDLLSTMGFAPYIKLSPAQLTAYMKAEDDMVMIHETDGLVVELHWEMSGRYLSRPMDMAFVNDRLQTATLLDRDVVHLSTEDLLLYLCIHGTRHMWGRLEWICGVAELIRNKKDLQWDLLYMLAREMKCRRILGHGVYLSHDLLGVKIPEQVTEQLAADPAQMQLAEQVKQLLFPLSRPDQTAESGNRFRALQFQVRDSLVEQIGYGWRQLTGSREADWRWLPLPAPLAFLYMFLRPVRLVLQYINKKMGWRKRCQV